jgi:hypothetical protein
MATREINIMSGMKQRSKEEELAYSHPGHFHEYVFGQKLATFHWEVFDILLEGRKEPLGDKNPIVILAPRNHAKTTNFAESYPLWIGGIDPNSILCQVISSTSGVASTRLSRIKSCIQHNDRYKELFGNLYPGREGKWATEAVELKRDHSLTWALGNEERDPSFAAYGITTSVEGGRATLQVFDDIVTFENSKTPAGRQTVEDKFFTTFSPMLLPMGQQIILGTRYSYNDFYATAIAKFDTERRYLDMYPEGEVEALDATVVP